MGAKLLFSPRCVLFVEERPVWFHMPRPHSPSMQRHAPSIGHVEQLNASVGSSHTLMMSEDTLTTAEKKLIERAFYKAGPLTSVSALEALLATLGQRLSDAEMRRWFPEFGTEQVDGAGIAPRGPILLTEVFEMMRLKKDAHRALCSDGDDETLSTFVSLGGNVDGTGVAHISALIEAVRQLKKSAGTSSEPQHNLSFSMKPSGTLSLQRSLRVDQRPTAVSPRQVDSEGDEGSEADCEDTPKIKAEDDTDAWWQVQLRSVPRHVGFAEFAECMSNLRAIATATSKSEQRGGTQLAAGSPADVDLLPQFHSAWSTRHSVAPTLVGMLGDLNHPLHKSGNLPSGRGANMKASVEDDWSTGDYTEAEDHVNLHDVDDVAASPSSGVLRALDRVVEDFRQRRAATTPEALLARISQAPPTGIQAMSSEGVTYGELEAKRKERARVTKPISTVMLLREEAKREILVMESNRSMQAQIEKAMKEKQRPDSAQNKSAARLSTPSYKPKGGPHSRDESQRRPDVATNAFVESIARHAAYVERLKRPASAALVAKRRAPVVVRERKNCVTKLQAARERAIELEVMKLDDEDWNADPTADTTAPSLHPVDGFGHPSTQARSEASHRISPFLKYPHPGVYRKLPREK